MSEKYMNIIDIDKVEMIFYIINAKNMMLKESKIPEICKPFIKLLDINVYGCRFGTTAQDPVALLKELEDYGDMDKFNIIFIDIDKDRTSILSIAEKEEFFKRLKTEKVENTGLLAKDVILKSTSNENII